MRTTRLPALLFVFALIVAACSSADTASTTTTTAADGDDSSPSTTRAVATATTEGEDTTTTAGGNGSVDADCVVGTWEMDSAAFVSQLGDLFAAEMQGATVEFTGGSYRVTFGGDGSFTGVRDDWSWRIVTTEGTLVQTINSEETGTYTIEGGEMSASVDPVTFDVKTQIEVDGQLIDLPTAPGGVTLDDDRFDPRGGVNCDGGELTVSAGEFELVFNKT